MPTFNKLSLNISSNKMLYSLTNGISAGENKPLRPVHKYIIFTLKSSSTLGRYASEIIKVETMPCLCNSFENFKIIVSFFELTLATLLCGKGF